MWYVGPNISHIKVFNLGAKWKIIINAEQKNTFPNLSTDFNFKFAGVNLAMKFPHYSQVGFGALWLEADDFFVVTK